MRQLLLAIGLTACSSSPTPVDRTRVGIPSDPVVVDPPGPGSAPDPDPGTTAPGTTPGTTTTTPPTGTPVDPPSPIDLCFAEILDPSAPSPDYDRYAPVVGSHCSGTNHQDIVGVQRVVFLGDSVTVGTPPTPHDEFYRNRLALSLATEFGLEAPGTLWQRVDLLSGTSLAVQSGDFWSCAEWGARADDLLEDGTQLEDCFPEETRDQVTLVVMTVGGNDLAALQEGFQELLPIDELWAISTDFTTKTRDAVAWLKDPVRFPAGNHVILTNPYEYTDGTGEVTACPGAGLAGLQDTTDPLLQEMVVAATEELMAISTEHGTDLVFALESFCGHGYNHDDPNNRCYRGPGAELWFDLTCIHPNPVGHAVLADLFMDVVLE